MIFDFKYHIFTITAIFAALGIGILIGTSLIGNDTIINKQQKLINNIKDDVGKIRNENLSLKQDINSLKDELQYRKEMEKKMLSLFLQKALDKKNYLLYTDANKNLNDIKEMFKSVGLNLQIINNINSLADIERSSKLILWKFNQNKDILLKKIKNYNLKEQVLFCKESDLIGLMLTLMESEMSEKNSNGQ